MKKFFSILIVLIIFGAIGALVAGFVVDDLTSKNIESTLNSINPPANSTVVQSVSQTGRITTKVGALQYYGAILVQSSQPLGVVRAHYEVTNKPEDLDVKVIPLSESTATFGNDMDGKLRFSHHDSAPNGYYIVYAFAEGQMPFPMLDYRSYIS